MHGVRFFESLVGASPMLMGRIARKQIYRMYMPGFYSSKSQETNGNSGNYLKHTAVRKENEDHCSFSFGQSEMGWL